jgi:hypothetical protein
MTLILLGNLGYFVKVYNIFAWDWLVGLLHISLQLEIVIDIFLLYIEIILLHFNFL